MTLNEIDEAIAKINAKPSTPEARRVLDILEALRTKLSPTLYAPVRRQPKTIDDLTKNRR